MHFMKCWGVYPSKSPFLWKNSDVHFHFSKKTYLPSSTSNGIPTGNLRDILWSYSIMENIRSNSFEFFLLFLYQGHHNDILYSISVTIWHCKSKSDSAISLPQYHNITILTTITTAIDFCHFLPTSWASKKMVRKK